jgi:hypothetical protein
MKKRHNPEEIVKILREAETTGQIVDTCRKYGISEQTGVLCRWQVYRAVSLVRPRN